MSRGCAESELVAMGGVDKVLLRMQPVPAWQDHLADQAPGRTMADVMALRRSAPLIRVVSPEMAIEDMTLTRAGRHVTPSECVGVWPAVLEMNLHTVAHGRFFNDIDEAEARSVCVIGTGIRDELFGKPEEVGREIIPVGERIQLNGQPFTIVGMFEHYESEQESKERALQKVQGKQAQTGPKRDETDKTRNLWALTEAATLAHGRDTCREIRSTALFGSNRTIRPARCTGDPVGSGGACRSGEAELRCRSDCAGEVTEWSKVPLC